MADGALRSPNDTCAGSGSLSSLTSAWECMQELLFSVTSGDVYVSRIYVA